MLENILGQIVKSAFGINDERDFELVEYRNHEIYLIPRQEGVYDARIHCKGKKVSEIQESILTKDEIVQAAKDWINNDDLFS